MAKIITIAGLAGAGKDTFAELLADALASRGVIADIDRFAAPLKAASLKLFGLSSEVTPERKERRGTARRADVHRALIPMLRWLRLDVDAGVRLAERTLARFATGDGAYCLSPRLFQQYVGTEVVRYLAPDAWVDRLKRDAEASSAQYLIVPDARFHNELLGTAYFVHRPGLPTKDHASEKLAKALDLIAERLGKSPDATVCGHPVIWNVGSEHLLQLQADAVAAKLHLITKL